MGKTTLGFTPLTSTAVLCCLGMSFTAMASPPPTPRPDTGARPLVSNDAHIYAQRGPAESSYIEGHSATSDPSALSMRHSLDLTPPAPQEFTMLPSSKRGNATEMLVYQDIAKDRSRADGDGGMPGSAQFIANSETFMQRFRHEGLPVARLWENHAAMVSLGLNPKGKPGLWLVQKIH